MLQKKKTLKFRKYQPIALRHLLRNLRSGLWAGMGTGKTVITLFAVKVLKFTDPGKTLVIAPKRVALNTWPDTAAEFEEFSDLSVVPVIGTPKQRLAALKEKADIYTINFENVPWLKENLTFNFAHIVIDESTRIKGFRLRKGSVQAKALRIISKKAKVIWELTGTSTSNGLIDLWAQLYFLDDGARLGKTFTAFKNRWFNQINCGHFTKVEPYDWSAEDISKKVSDICLSIEAKDWFDLKEPIENFVEVTLPPKVFKQYKQMEREMYSRISEEKYISGVNAAGKTSKCLQIASGGMYDENKQWVNLHDEKLEALSSIVEEAAGAPILVAYHWKQDLVRIKKRFPKCVDLSSKKGIIERWNDGKIQLLAAHPASAGHGLNLQHGGNILVYFSHWWNREHRDQILERIGPTRQAQSGYDRPVFVYNIVAKHTIDYRVIEAHKYKVGIQEILTRKTNVLSRG